MEIPDKSAVRVLVAVSIFNWCPRLILRIVSLLIGLSVAGNDVRDSLVVRNVDNM